MTPDTIARRDQSLAGRSCPRIDLGSSAATIPFAGAAPGLSIARLCNFR
jgi:hypothetical protein